MATDCENESIKNTSLKRVALSIQYQGTDYCGWQRQKDKTTVQSILEECIFSLEPYNPVKLVVAGRTDSGVHAAGQVAHFDSVGQIPICRWPSALNGRLPNTIRVRAAVNTRQDWHACYSAIYRRYRYIIYNGCGPNIFLAPWSWHRYQYRLDEKLMAEAAQSLLGYHDFGAFQRSGSHRAHSFTTIQDIQLERKGDLLFLEIQASGFLYGMVRLLVGQLVAIGEHKLSLKDFERRWTKRLRSEIKEAAPSRGLCLIRVGYAESIFRDNIVVDSFPGLVLLTSDPPCSP